MLNKLYLYYKVLVNYIAILVSYYKRNRKVGNYENAVVLDFRKIDRERNYAQLVFFFHKCKYQIILMHHPLFLGNMTTYGKYIVNLPNVSLKLFSPKDIDVAFYFYDTRNSKRIRYRKRIFINDDIFSLEKKLSELELVPFPMIPRIYYQGHYDFIENLRNTNKSYKLYFSGNQNKSDYDSPIFETFFSKLNRIEVIETLRKELKSSEILLSDDSVDLINPEEKYQNKFVCHYWTRVSLQSNKIQGRINNNEWLPTLAKADFFLACPGFVQPMCHNQIEAMSLGVILVLEHPEFFDPPLGHMKNCIAFCGKEDLIKKVRWVLNADSQTIARMREAVLEYYNQYLSPASFCRRIENKKNGEHTLYVITSDYVYRELVLKQ